MITALYQRLKELDSAEFEDLCFQIWSEKLPGCGLRRVEGKAGDKGADLFIGDLARKLAIWQCKLFRDGVKDVQKKQIKKSLKTALTHFRPSVWTLCVPINLDINAHAWFQKLAQLHPNLRIDLFDASLIVKEMIFRHPIREAFFPGVGLNLEEIKNMLRGTGSYSDDQLAKLADESVEQYVERLRGKDPRYDYQVSFLSGSAGVSNASIPSKPLFPNAVVSMRRGNRQVDVIARDVEALRKDPPRITLELSIAGVEKIQHALSSGLPTLLGHGELMGFRSSFDFLMSSEELEQPHELLLAPQFPTFVVNFRVRFASAAESVSYDLIEFAITKGQHGIELRSTSEHVPFQIRMAFDPADASYDFEMTAAFHGHDILEVEKFFSVLSVLRGGGTLEFFDLKKQQTIGPISVQLTTESNERAESEQLMSQLAEVSRVFGQRLVAPEVVNRKDLESLAFLLEVSRRGEIIGGTAENFTASLVRDDRAPDSVLAPLAEEFMIGLDNEDYPAQHLLGAEIHPGPCRMIIENASLVDFEDVKKRYTALSPGESIRVSFASRGPVRQVFPRFYKGEALSPLVAP